MTPTTDIPLIDVETEEALLGALLVEGGALSLCLMERLGPEMFGITRNGWVYAAMLDLHRRGDEIDPITVANELERRGQLHETNSGDGDYLLKLMAFRSGGLAYRTYAAEIRRLHEWRQFEALGTEIVNVARKRGDGKSVITSWSEIRRKTDDARPYEPNANFTFGADTFETYRQMLDDMQEQSAAYDQPFDLLNDVYGKAQPGDMFGIVGPTGSGKSSLLSTIAEYYASSVGLRTALVFTEMRLKKVLDRRMAKHSDIDYRRLKNPVTLTEGEQQMLVDAEEQIFSWAHKLDYWHASAPSAGELLATMRRMNSELGTQVFVIDHMNDVDVSEYRSDAKNWVLFLIDLEAFCNDTGSILWTAAQTNRNDGKAYFVGQAFDHKMSLVCELQPSELSADFSYSFGGKEYAYRTGKNSPVVPMYFRKNREGGPSRGKLLFVGPRYLWLDVPDGFDDGSDDPGAYDDVYRGGE